MIAILKTSEIRHTLNTSQEIIMRIYAYKDVLSLSSTNKQSKKYHRVIQQYLSNEETIWPPSDIDSALITIEIKKFPPTANTATVKLSGTGIAKLLKVFKQGFTLIVKGTRGVGERFQTKPMEVVTKTLATGDSDLARKISTPFCEETGVLVPGYFFQPGNENAIKYIIAIAPKGISITNQASPEIRAFMSKILHDNIDSDVTLLSKNGESLKCNKVFLSAHSDVFSAMLNAQMAEAKTGLIETEMDTEILKAFLEYLYTWEVSAPLMEPQVALELLKAGHKYNIQGLGNEMKEILLNFPDELFTVDEAVRLFLFVKNVEEYKSKLKNKTVLAIVANKSEVESSMEYAKLFQNDSTFGAATAKELTIAILFAFSECLEKERRPEQSSSEVELGNMTIFSTRDSPRPYSFSYTIPKPNY